MVTANPPDLPAAADLVASSSRVMGLPAEGCAELIVAEYESLRCEILKLIELQAQLISLIVVALGTMLSFGLQMKNSTVILVYPLLSLILGISWLNHSHAISRCAAYLSQELEPRFGRNALGWENYVRKNPLRYGMLGYWGVRSIFMGSSVTAVISGMVILRGTAVEIVLVAFSCIVTAATIVIFLVWREPSPRKILIEDRAKVAGKTRPVH